MAKQIVKEVREVVLTEEPRSLSPAETDITSLTSSWKEVLGGDLAVIHDAPPSRGHAFQLASGVFEAIRKHDRLVRWSRRAFQVAFIHCAAKSTPIAMTANAIHFYEPTSEVDPELGWQIFDSLSEQQQQDYAKLCPRTVNARADFGEAFALLSTLIGRRRAVGRTLDVTRPNVLLVDEMSGDFAEQRVIVVGKDLHESPILSQGSYLRNAVTQTIKSQLVEVAWDDDQNQRRCDLIDKEIEGTITDLERIELSSLHARLRQHLDEVAPVAVEGARKLHEQLLEKKRQLQLRS